MRRQTERKTRSHSLALSPWCRINSGWILSTPAALFGLTHRAVLIPSVEVSACGTSEVSHHHGAVSGESLVRIG